MSKTLQTAISSVSCGEYGHGFVVTTVDGEVTVFQASDMAQISKFKIPTSTPLCASVSSNEFGPLIAVGCSNGDVIVFKGGRVIQTFTNSGSVLSVAFHRSHCTIASASLNGTFSVHELKGGRWDTVSVPVAPMGLSSICWGSDGDMLQTLILGGVDGTVRVMKCAGGAWELSSTTQVHNGWVRRVSAPNVPLSSHQKVATCGDDGRVFVVKVVGNSSEAREIKPIEGPGGVSWAMVDKTLVVAHVGGETSVWTENEGEWQKKDE